MLCRGTPGEGLAPPKILPHPPQEVTGRVSYFLHEPGAEFVRLICVTVVLVTGRATCSGIPQCGAGAYPCANGRSGGSCMRHTIWLCMDKIYRLAGEAYQARGYLGRDSSAPQSSMISGPGISPQTGWSSLVAF